MQDRAGVVVTGPLAPYAAGFEEELARRGYRPDSARRLLSLMAHASRWSAGQGATVADLGPAQVEQFCRSRRQEGHVGYLTPKAMSPLIGYLRGLGVVAIATNPQRQTAVDEVIERYKGYLVAERGAAPATVRTLSLIHI